MSQQQKTIKLGNYAHYDVEKNELHTYEGIGLIEGLNQMFNVGILPQANKSRINVYNSTLTFEDGSVVTRLAPRELLQYLANEKGLPIDLNKSRAVQGYRRWILTFTDDYAKAVQKQEEHESTKDTETQIINNKEGNTNEANDWEEKKENCTNDDGSSDEAGVPQEQEGTPDESGAPDLGTDGSGSEQQLVETSPVVSNDTVEEPAAQPKKRGPKKKA